MTTTYYKLQIYKNMQTNKPAVKKIVSVIATLRDMQAGQCIIIPTRTIKLSSLRTAAFRLKKNGYEFIISERGLIDQTSITCIKRPNQLLCNKQL